jgi:transcriptional regulator with XRE-family HTH domain
VSENLTLQKFGVRIKELRANVGISQEKLAELSELHRTYISGIERGERNVSLININLIANALNISLSELFKGID